MCLVVFIEVVQLQLTLLQGAFSDLALG